MFSSWRSHGMQYWGVIARRVLVGLIGTIPMHQIAGEQEHRACRHERLHYLVWSRIPCRFPQMTARHQFGSAIAGGEIIERPDAADAQWRARSGERVVPHAARGIVDVPGLRCFSRVQVDGECG